MGANNDRRETITDQQIEEFAHTLVRGLYRDPAIDQEQALSFMRSLLRRIITKTINTLDRGELLTGGSRDSLGELFFDVASIELTQVLGTFSEAFSAAMKVHTGPTPEPTSTL